MNYNNQYEHITVKISSLNLSLIPIVVAIGQCLQYYLYSIL